MKKLFLPVALIFLIVFVSSRACSFVEEILLGLDSYGSEWYLDTNQIVEKASISSLELTITTYALLPYRQWVMSIYADDITGDTKRLERLFLDTRKMSQRYIIDLDKNLWCLTNVFLYDYSNELIDSKFFGIINNDWYSLSGSTLLRNAINWIKASSLKSDHRRRNIEELLQEFSQENLELDAQNTKSLMNDATVVSLIFCAAIFVVAGFYVLHTRKTATLPQSSSQKLGEKVEYVDAILVDDEDGIQPHSRVRGQDHSFIETKQFVDCITRVEKIILTLLVIIVLSTLLNLADIITPPRYMPRKNIRDICISSFMSICVWFSVRYSFYYAKKLRVCGRMRTSTFVRCLGILISLAIIWAYGFHK